MTKVFPLHEAAKSGDCEAIGQLLEMGWEVDQENTVGERALVVAVKHDHLAAAKLLVAGGADPRSGGVWGDSPLQVAAERGSDELVRLLLQQAAPVNRSPVKGVYEKSEPPLHLAAENGHVSVARTLLAAGARPDDLCCRMMTALHHAALSRSVEMIDLMLKHRVSITGIDGQDGTPLQVVAAEGDAETAEYLIQRGGRLDAGSAVDLGLWAELQALVEVEPSCLRRRGLAGDTPLHRAARKGQLAASQFLIEAGAEIGVRNSHGSTPLHLAALSGNAELCQLLIACGADVNVRGRLDATPLFMAATKGHYAAASVLLKHGADANATCRCSCPTPLAWAILLANVDLARLLLDHGASVRGRMVFGDTLLQGAADRSKAIHEMLRAQWHKGMMERNRAFTKWVLWIDDHVDSLPDAVVDAFGGQGYGIWALTDNDDALTFVKDQAKLFDAVIQDLQRPPGECLREDDTDHGEMSGLVFYLKYLRVYRPDTPCIFVTANVKDPRLYRVLESDTNCSVTSKPITADKITEIIQRVRHRT